MKHFADLHIHALFGVDDGPKTKEDMFAMIDAAYADGTRYLCLTPHFHPGYYKTNPEQVIDAYSILETYTSVTYPDLHLAIGNELHYSKDCVSWLADGLCKTMNGTEYVLIDFHEGEEARNITHGLHQLLNAGYTPILAHAERYKKLHWTMKELKDYRLSGVILQADGQSLLGGFGLITRERCKAMLRAGLIDLIASDAHDTVKRPPQLSAVHTYIRQNYDAGLADALCYETGYQLLWGMR